MGVKNSEIWGKCFEQRISSFTYVAFMPIRMVIQSVQKETQTFKLHLLRVKTIECKNDSISVALSFNKELYSEVLS